SRIDNRIDCRRTRNGVRPLVCKMKSAERHKRETEKSKTSFRGANNGRHPPAREVIPCRKSAAEQRRSEASRRIRQAFSISAATFGNGAPILTKAERAERRAIGESCAEVRGPRATSWKCNRPTGM